MSTLTQEEIRPAQMMADKKKFVDADRDFLLERKDKWVLVNCPACGQDHGKPFGQKQGFAYQHCDDCQTVYTNPRPSLELLHQFYSQSKNYAYWNEHIFPATEDVRRQRIFRPRAERLAELCDAHNIPGGTLLEVGAAFGTFCTEVNELSRFDKVIALEPTPGLAQTCRQRGLETMESFIEDIEETGFADVVAAFEVLEHLFDPKEFVQHVHRILKPSGAMILSCPNVKGFDVSTLKMLSSTFDHEHVNYFHPDSLSLLCDTNGFDVLQVATPGRLDAELVRNEILAGNQTADNAFLNEVLINNWERLGENFQDFLASNCLSSHMWIVARKR